MNTYRDTRKFTEEYLEEFFELEFTLKDVAAIEALRTIDPNLCSTVYIGYRGEEWFIAWREQHPEMMAFDDYFPKDDSSAHAQTKGNWSKILAALWAFTRNWIENDSKSGSYAKRTKRRLRQWNELQARLPASHHVKRITRRQAFVAVVRLSLPTEIFFADAGV